MLTVTQFLAEGKVTHGQVIYDLGTLAFAHLGVCLDDIMEAMEVIQDDVYGDDDD